MDMLTHIFSFSTGVYRRQVEMVKICVLMDMLTHIFSPFLPGRIYCIKDVYTCNHGNG